MSYIITDDKHYKNIANSIRSKMQTDREYYPEDMAIAIDNIPSSADGTDSPIGGIYLLNPDDDGYPTEIKFTNLGDELAGLAFNAKKFSRVRKIEYLNCRTTRLVQACFSNLTELISIDLPETINTIGYSAFQYCRNLVSIKLPESLSYMYYSTFHDCNRLSSINIPAKLILQNNSNFNGCYRLKDVTIGNGFNSENLVLSASTLYTRETILQWLNALADRTGQTAYKLTIGATNLAKLTEEDILIATNKNWTLA